MSKVLKKVFKVEVNGKEVELAALRPSAAEEDKAGLAYGKAFREAVDNKFLLRAKIDSVMREQQLWDDKKQARHDELVKAIREGERDLKAGGISLSAARTLAIQVGRNRREWQALRAERTQMDSQTAEGRADQARFSYLVATCTVFAADKKPVFKDVSEYRACEEPYAYKAAEEFANLWHDVDANYEKNLVENQFLVKHGFVNEKLQYIDKAGHLTDSEGRLVDGDGRYVNELGEFVDRDGNRLDKEGSLLVENPLPFLGDDGKPLPSTDCLVGVNAAPPPEPEVHGA